MCCNGARPKDGKGLIKTHVDEMNNYSSENDYLSSKATTISDIFNVLSVRLYDDLDRVGASDEFRKLRQECAIAREIIRTISSYWICNSVSKIFIFGSSSEGTTTPGLNSDTDYLHCHDLLPVIENISEDLYGTSALMIRDINTKPGYVKLQCVHYGQPLTVQTCPWIYIGCENNYFKSDKKGRICRKHISKVGYTFTVQERNGPADTNTQLNFDQVDSFRCSKIPNFAREWIGRRRQFRWPSKRILYKMAKMGCFLVGVAHPASDERQIEWRVSFSLQERELMFSMNLVQHKCYIVLKMIKKDLIEPVVGKSISSYHLKTCMFHVMETTKSRIWKRKNLGQCVVLCMHVLLQWVNKGYCPNYFITEENMFDRDIHRLRKIKLVQRLRHLLTNCEFILHIKLDRVSFYWKRSMNHVQNELLQRVVLNEKCSVKLKTLCDTLLCRNGICYTANTEISALSLIYNVFNFVSETNRLSDYSEHQTNLGLSLTKPFIQIQLAQSYASLAFSVQSPDDKYRLLQKSGHHLHESRYCCPTLSKLLQATVVYKLEHYEKCLHILEHMELVLTQNHFPICECNSFDRCFRYYSYKRVEELKGLSVSSILERTSPCVIFLRSDFPILHEALKFEYFRSVYTPPQSRRHTADDWFDLAVVDAIVYFHFLNYIAFAKLNRYFDKHVAIHKLESVLKPEFNLDHRETGYNLLGWIYFNEGWIKKGIKYLRLSWAIRPHHNAAKFHILNIFID